MNKLLRLQMLAAIALVILGVSSAYAYVAMVPNSLVLDEVTPSEEVVISYDHLTTVLRGYSIEVAWNPALATAVFSPPDFGLFNTHAIFGTTDIAPGRVLVDGAINGDFDGILSGELFKVTFTAVPNALGTAGIDLIIESMRGDENQEVDGGVATGGSLDVDMYAPTVTNVLIENNSLGHTNDFVKNGDAVTITAKVTDYEGLSSSAIVADLSQLGGDSAVNPTTYVDPNATWTLGSVTTSLPDGMLTVEITATDSGPNSAMDSDTITADNTAPTALTGVEATPGHQKLHLAWDDFAGNDLNIKGIEFRYNVWGDYPLYDNLEPAYPADQTSGTSALTTESAPDTNWIIAPRDIYYVAGFVYDQALNYSDAGSIDSQGLATNYWLGDVAGPGETPPPEGFPDGLVNVEYDITRLGDTYGLPDGHDDFDMYCNVGPTDSSSPKGIPNPNGDNKIGFEDMMIFALNWDVVSPTTKNLIGGTPVLAWRQVDETTWALSLVDRGGDLQGLNLRAELPKGVDCTVTGGDLLAEQPEPVFLRNIPGHGIDAGLALFGQGAGFSGSGELVRISLSEPVADIEIAVTARDADNKDLSVELGTGSGSSVPTVARFAQNYPNPFNPRTTLAFELPQERQVHLAIYAVDGTRVRTLVDGMREAGRHEVSWDGRDDTGRSVAAGTYFGRVIAGDLNQIRKMVLVK